METLEEVLRSVVEGIGYKAAGAEQRRAILSFVQGKDAFVSLSDRYSRRLKHFNRNIRGQLNSLRLWSGGFFIDCILWEPGSTASVP